MRRLLLVGAFSCVATLAFAGPNETCANESYFEMAQSLLKDQTGLGQQARAFLSTYINLGTLPPDYTPSSFYRDLATIGAEGFAEKMIAGIRALGSKAGQQVTAANLKQFTELKKVFVEKLGDEATAARADLFNHYLIIIAPPIATRFDDRINRVTCSFKYRIDTARSLAYVRRFPSANAADDNFLAQMDAYQSSTGYSRTGVYVVQPDGKSGRTVTLLSAQ